MRIFLPTTQDASIYQSVPSSNTGLDEILEVGKYTLPSDVGRSILYESASVRSLVTFNLEQNQFTSSAEYFLNLHIADAQFINRYQELKVHLVSSSWVEGSGYRYQNVKNVSDGVSWVSASRNILWNNEGGDYVALPTASFTFSEIPFNSNLKINVTDLVKPVISGSNIIPWNGLLLKFTDEDEQDVTIQGTVKFYSGNTHTVFEPKLEVVWNDQVFNTGSFKPIPGTNVNIVARNIREAYTRGELDKVYLVVRDKYPDKRFDATQRYRNQYYLPSESYFRIKDQAADFEIHPFDAYSAIHCDASGSYILLDTAGLNLNRYYDLELKVKRTDLVFFPEFKYTFKIDSNE
jgi:hypothetical protein